MANVVCVCEHKCFVDVKSNGNDILCIGNGKTVDFLNCEVFPKELFIICKLNDQWNIKCILQQTTNVLISLDIYLL